MKKERKKVLVLLTVFEPTGTCNSQGPHLFPDHVFLLITRQIRSDLSKR